MNKYRAGTPNIINSTVHVGKPSTRTFEDATFRLYQATEKSKSCHSSINNRDKIGLRGNHTARLCRLLLDQGLNQQHFSWKAYYYYYLLTKYEEAPQLHSSLNLGSYHSLATIGKHVFSADWDFCDILLNFHWLLLYTCRMQSTRINVLTLLSLSWNSSKFLLFLLRSRRCLDRR